MLTITQYRDDYIFIIVICVNVAWDTGRNVVYNRDQTSIGLPHLTPSPGLGLQKSQCSHSDGTEPGQGRPTRLPGTRAPHLPPVHINGHLLLLNLATTLAPASAQL